MAKGKVRARRARASCLVRAVLDAREMIRQGASARKAHAQAAASHGLTPEVVAGADFMPARTQLMCRGVRHTLVVTPNGQIACLNHERGEWPRQSRFAEIGGEPCACLEAIRQFGEVVDGRGDTSCLPKGLRPAATSIRDGRRRKERESDDQSWSTMPWTQRPESLMRMLDRVLHRRLGLPQHVHAVVTFRGMHRRPIPGSVYSFQIVSGPDTLLDTLIPADWEEKVRRTGLAVLDGAVVVDYEFNDEHRTKGHLRLCRPNVLPYGNIRFDMEHAGVQRGDDGRLRLSQ